MRYALLRTVNGKSFYVEMFGCRDVAEWAADQAEQFYCRHGVVVWHRIVPVLLYGGW
jgi:hypothetical protein